MKEEVISSGATNAVDPLLGPLSTSPPPTPVASSAGASSPCVPTNAGSTDWLGHSHGSKAGSPSCIGPQPLQASLSASVGGSAYGIPQTSCRPWERGDLLRRLGTFTPANWVGKPKATSSLACARRGWVNVDVNVIECEVCGANLTFISSTSQMPAQADGAGEDFAEQLDEEHKVTCPWRGNCCAESLVQFPPTPPAALIGGYKDRCDGLLQFFSLPIIAASTIEQMRLSRSPQIDRFLFQSQTSSFGESSFKAENIVENSCVRENIRDDTFFIYAGAQKLISLCGWEPRWLPSVQDCEENSAQSARNGCSTGFPQGPGPSKKAFSTSNKKYSGKNDLVDREYKCESRSPLLDCSLCGATVMIWGFRTVPRPARFAPNSIDIPESSKKMALTRGISAASGISGWVPTNGLEKEQTEDHDEAATTDGAKLFSNAGVNLDLAVGGGVSSAQMHTTVLSKQCQNADMGRDLMIVQPSSSEVGDRAASYESRGPNNRKRSLDEGGSTIDRPHLRVHQADSVEGTVIDRDGDEVNDCKQYSAGPSKRARDSEAFEAYCSSYMRDSGAGPSHSLVFENETNPSKVDSFLLGNDVVAGIPFTRDSTHLSSVIAMDTIGHSAVEDSMESVENYPGDVDDVNFPSITSSKNPDLNETSEVNYSNQVQQSNCFQQVARVAGETGVSCTNGGEEVLNNETVTAHARDGLSFGVSGGSVGMGASHEAEIHGANVSVQRVDGVVGDVEPVCETGEFAPDPRLMDDFAPGKMDQEDPHGDSQDMISRSVGRTDSGSKVVGSVKAESFESGEKTSNIHMSVPVNDVHPSISCNAIFHSGYEASKEEVTQAGKTSPLDDFTFIESGYVVANGIGSPPGESNGEEDAVFDPIKHHNDFCPWVNGNVAAAGCCGSGPSSSGSAMALSGWQLTLEALDAFQLLGHVLVQTVESESAASLYKDDHPSRKLLAHHSFSRSHG